MPGFTHLHVHSEYSLLDGLARVPDLVAAARGRGFDALALTDHGVMFGAIRFYKHAKQVGLKPIIGCEVYVARRTRHDREPRHDSRPHHLTILAQNDVGYRNLLALVSLAQLEGFYYRPRVDREILERHAEGLVVLSGCPSSEVARLLRDGQTDQARDVVAWYREVFPGRYYIEVQRHDIDFLPDLNRHLVDIAGDFALPLVATNDVHYALPQDATAHDVLLCVQTGTTTTNPDRMRYGSTFYLRTEQEMRALFHELPEAVDNTVRIAEACNVGFKFHEYKLPVFDVPAGHSAGSYLRELCEAGLAERYPDAGAEVRQRLDYELSVIHEMGFDDYFLIVWDLCRFAREEGIWWNVRGSGAGALVSNCLKITNLDPLAHNLIFERFLNPARVSMPDIDLDFPDDQRDAVIRYAYDLYGHDRVAQIITFGTMGPRAAIRDAGRALDMPLSLVDQVARLVPAIPGKPCHLGDALRAPTADDPNEFFSPGLTAMAEEPDVERLLDAAQSLEGVARHASTHAAGVVIADRPLVDYLPLHRPTSSAEGALPLTQYAMKDVENLGLLKVDFLGLSTLTVLRRAAELVATDHGVHYALDSIPLDDPGIYELLSSGDVAGVFQVEGAGMRRTLRDMRPTKFE
ncbi:MAG: DNA polymerase III subunit alpha, partial [Anaerolineae bacterium]